MRIPILLVSLAFVACGGSSSSGPTEAPINLTSTGASSTAITIPSGGKVHFFNKDTANHQMTSAACAALNSPSLAPGADYLSPAITGPVTCAFSDSLNPNNQAFKGTVTVGAPGSTGGGSGY